MHDFRTRQLTGLWYLLHDAWRQRVRQQTRRGSIPAAAILDSQRVKLSTAFDPIQGYDAGKPVKDHKRYLPVDRRGWLLPCNLVVRQDEVGKVQVAFRDPGAVPDRVGKPDISLLADEATQRRERVRPAL